MHQPDELWSSRSTREDQASSVLRAVDGISEEDRGDRQLWRNLPSGPGREKVGQILIMTPSPGVPRDLLGQLTGFKTIVIPMDEGLSVPPEWREPDVILLDATQSAEGTAECCRSLRENEQLMDCPIVVALTPGTQPVLQECLEAGADEVLMTPCQPAELQVRLRNMMELHRNVAALGKKNHILNEALSDLCESEAMLVQAEKLSVLGEMSAGIVHEINNPLNYSATALFVLRSLVNDLDEEHREEFSEVIADIKEGMERVNHIVRDLRSFASRGTMETVELSLVSLVRTARRLLGDRLGTIGYKESIPEELRISGNENQLCQVFLNILKNGVEATELAGRSLEEAEVRVWTEVAGPWVDVHFRDNGNGIAPGDLKRIFEPFFSRKSKGKGMGLGLSICSRILDEHRARISVQSELGSHTQFTIRFPREDHFGDEPEEVIID